MKIQRLFSDIFTDTHGTGKHGGKNEQQYHCNSKWKRPVKR